MCERCDNLLDTLQQIFQWSLAYPVDVFHEPTPAQYQRAHELLMANEMTLDAFNASVGRHILKEIGGIVGAALDVDRISRSGDSDVGC